MSRDLSLIGLRVSRLLSLVLPVDEQARVEVG
jgi:hypothetical protein